MKSVKVHEFDFEFTLPDKGSLVLLSDAQKGTLEKRNRVLEEVINNPDEYLTLNVSKLGERLGIPVSTLFVIWNKHIKGKLKFMVRLKEEK